MLRLIFVLGIVVVGGWYALQRPFYALLFYVWYAYFRPEAWVWHGDLIKSLHISYVAGVLLVGSALLRGRRLRLNAHLALVPLFAAHAVVSTVLSKYGDHAAPLLVEFLKSHLLVVCMIVVLVDEVAKLRLLVLVMALSLAFEGAKQGWLGLAGNPGEQNINPIPFLGDNNGVAVGMLMLVPVLSALGQTAATIWHRRFYQFLMVGVLYRAITTYSRGGFLACGALGAMYWWRSRNKLAVLLSMLVVTAVILPVLPHAFWDRMGTILELSDTEDTSARGRLHFWGVAVSMANTQPILGVGFDAYNVAYGDFDPAAGQYGTRRSVHSVWFGILAELGYVGLFLYALIFLLAYRNCRRISRLGTRFTELADLRPYAAALETGLVVFFVGGTFLSFQYSEMAWHYVALSMALSKLTQERVAAAESVREEPSARELVGEPAVAANA
jgi:probable O-glycosylation ligase (exosortase A-associated)